jgi:shikimate dehydrogenase
MSLRYAVFGHPVAHSRSPHIHAAFAAQVGIDLVYERIDAPPDRFADAVDAFARDGGRGANVTLPHKQAAAALCASVSARAARAGAVNTLVRTGTDAAPAWIGDNTDGTGLVRDLRDRHGLVLDDARVLLLGAGGAGAGVAPALLDAGVARLVVANRSVDRARALADHLHDGRVVAAPLDGVDMPDIGAPFDLVVNATSAARAGGDPWAALGRHMAAARAAVDLGYGEAAAPFLAFARRSGVQCRIDGLGMLVEQAAESFLAWHGVMPATAPVHDDLRAALGGPP